MIERIHIERLQVQAHVGVPAEERVEPQRLVLNITVFPRIAKLHDELAETANYSAIAKAVREITTRRHYKLIETVADEVGAELLRGFDLRRVQVEVRKFVLADAEYVSVVALRDADTP